MAMTRATSKQLTHKSAPTGSVVRNVFNYLEDTLNVKSFGATGDGTTDDTAAVQAAINAASANSAGRSVYFPAGEYKLTSTITITAAVTIIGESPKSIKIGGGIGGGTWFFLSHTGKGFNINNSVDYYSDVRISHVGTYRTQPTPAPGWTPTSHDWDFFIQGLTDINFFDVTLLNPTLGIKQLGGGGRINIDYVKMHALKEGIIIESAFDVCRINNVHMWPFWADDADVHAYTLANMNGISLGRCDNPFLSNIFTIFANIGMRFYQTDEGATSKVHLVNADFDAGINGIKIDNNVTDGVTGQFANITQQGFDGSNNSVGLLITGTSSIISFTSLKTLFCGANGIRVDGSGNTITVSDATILYHDQSGSGFAAVEVAANNRVEIGQKPFIVTAAPAVGGKYAGAGRIAVDDWRTFTPNFSSSSGSISAFGSSTGRYKIVGDTVHVKCNLLITDNGTGSGSLEMNHPISTTPAFRGAGFGREIALYGKTINVQVTAAVNVVIIVNYDNTYPGGSGSQIDIEYSYIIQ